MGVVLLVAVGVVLLSCVCIVCYPHLPPGSVTRKPEVAKQLSCMSPRTMRADDIDHVRERERMLNLSLYFGDQLWQLMTLSKRSFCGEAGTVVAAHCHHE